MTGPVIRIGTSGWSYDRWHRELYPPGLPARDRLARYAAAFGTAELNSSFYRWPRPAAFGSWRVRLPEGFRLSVKAPRGLTHAGKLYAPEAWLQRIAAGWHELGGKREVDEHVVAGQVPLPDPVRPPPQVGVGVGTAVQVMMIRAVHPDVDQIGGSAQRARQVRPAHHAIRGPVRLQQREDLLAMPAAVPELHRHPHPARDQPEDIRQPGIITRQRGRQLDQQHRNNDGHAHAVRNARTLRALPVSGAASHPAAHAVNTS